MHDHPDPDAIASAFGLQYLVRSLCGVRSRIAHGGVVGRIENKTMVKHLDIPVYPLRAPSDFKRYRSVALVDTQPDFENNSLPAGAFVDLVIDHHPPVASRRVGRAFIVPKAGATSVILAQALLRLARRFRSGMSRDFLDVSVRKNPAISSKLLSVEIPRSGKREAGFPRPMLGRLATALAYGILSETQDLGRDTRALDIRTYKELLPWCDMRSLALIQNPPKSKEFFRVLNRSLDNAFVTGELIGVHLGSVDTPDWISQTADFLVSYEAVRWAVCTGRYQSNLHISVRALRPRRHAGDLLRRALCTRERAGGHRSIAGGSLCVGPQAGPAQWRRAESQVVAGLLRCLYGRRRPPVRYPFRIQSRGGGL